MPASRPELVRFSEKVAVGEDVSGMGHCWLWTGSRNWGGYGNFRAQGRTSLAHRWAYEHFVGPIPEGLQLDHLCRVRHCVNPRHLEPVTQRENLLRGESPAAIHARTTHCPRGHDYDTHGSRNTRGDRRCRQCERERGQERRECG